MTHKKNKPAQAKLRATPVKKEKLQTHKTKKPLKRTPKPVSNEIVAIRSLTLENPTKSPG